MLKPQLYLVVTVLFLAISVCGGHELPNQFVGCYSSPNNESQAYDVDLLSWNVCVRLCLEKNVKYAGIEALTKKCYCGNNLVERSEKVEPHLCDEECFDEKIKTCGGDKFFSMYRIQEEVPAKFMVATDNGIAYFQDKVLSSNFACLSKVSTIKLVYHYAENEVYFIAANSIWRSQYKAVMMEYMPAGMMIQLGNKASSIALDWVSHKLYWTLPHKLIESNLDGSGRREVAYLKSASKDLSIDPYERKIFLLQKGTIHLYDLKARKMTENNLLKFNRFEEVTCLTVDPQTRVVYAVAFYERRRRDDADGYLISVDYQGSMLRILLRRRDLDGTFSLTALDGQLYWAEINQKKTKKALYSFSITSQNTELGKPTKLATLPTTIQDVKLYDPRTQMSQKEYFCEKNKCSHICTMTSTSSVECSCPENWILATDQRTCQEDRVVSEETSDDKDDETEEQDVDDKSERTRKKKKKGRKHKKHRGNSRYR